MTPVGPVKSQSPSRVRAGKRDGSTGARGPQWLVVQRGGDHKPRKADSPQNQERART